MARQGPRAAGWLLAGLLAARLSCAQAPADVYVAVDGRDTWSGRIPRPAADGRDGPLASLAAARDAVRRARAGNPQQARWTVAIGPGTYELPETLRLTSEDRGLRFVAATAERPVLSGGTRLSAWRQDGNRWTTTVEGVAASEFYGRQLFVNGVRQTRARWPNEGVLRTDGPPRFGSDGLAALREQVGDRLNLKSPAVTGKFGFRYCAGDLQAWPGLDDVVLHVFHAWTSAVHWIAALDEPRRTVRFTGPSRFASSHFEAQQPYFVENLAAALDAPGEWYLERQTGLLTWLAPAGSDPNQADCVISRLPTLVSLDGDAELGRFVSDVAFRGLSFRYADWGPLDRAAENDGLGSIHFLNAAVMVRAATGCRFEDCEIAGCGGYGLYLIDGCADNLVQRCEVHDLGGGGILIGSRWSPYDTFGHDLPADDAPPEVVGGRNVVDNCYLHGLGRIFRGVVGIFVGHSPDNRITHNELCDLSYSGMIIGRRLDLKFSHAHHNEVAYNHIHHLGDGTMSDMGGIYTEGVSPGTRLHHNLIHDVRRYRYGGWGLYCDQGSTGIQLDHNLVHDCQDGGYMQNTGGPNVLANNILAGHLDRGLINSGRSSNKNVLDALDVRRNVFYTNLGQIIGHYLDDGDDYRFDQNVYWTADGRPPLFGERDWAAWRQSGQDEHSVIADPLFVDPEQGDYRLRPGSPAEALGFEPIDTTEIGLYGDPDWAAAPRKLVFRPLVPIDPPPPQQVDEDFESLEVGEAVPGTTVYGETAKSSIRVSDETAASGRQALKFVDAAGLSKPHWPWLAFRPERDGGRATVTFALRAEANAIAWHEWRDNAAPYHVGPSVQVRDGGLYAGSRRLGDVPADVWLRFTIRCALGEQADGTWALRVELPDQPVIEVSGLPCAGGPEFRSLRWLGYISLAETGSVFYLDDLRLAEP